MKRKTIIIATIVLMVAMTLAACGGSNNASVLEQELLTEASGIRVTAQNATSDNSVKTAGAMTVGEGDVVIISPDLTEGSLHLVIASSNGKTVVYDGDVDGRVLFSVEAEPGTYDITTSGNGGTGTMTVFSQSASEKTAQDESLADALEQEGVSSEALVGE